MDHGRLLALDSPEALMRSLAGETTLELAADGPGDETLADALAALPGVERTEPLQSSPESGETFRIRLYLKGDAAPLVAPAAVALAEHGLALNDVRFGTPTLEDVFINLTGRSLR